MSDGDVQLTTELDVVVTIDTTPLVVTSENTVVVPADDALAVITAEDVAVIIADALEAIQVEIDDEVKVIEAAIYDWTEFIARFETLQDGLENTIQTELNNWSIATTGRLTNVEAKDVLQDAKDASQDLTIASHASLISAITFPYGITMLFHANTAPTGWVRRTDLDDSLVRCMGNTNMTAGGSNGFSAVNAQTAVGNTTLDTNTMAYHAHNSEDYWTAGGAVHWSYTFTPSTGATTVVAWSDFSQDAFSYPSGWRVTDYQGGGWAHSHAVSFSIKYVDVMYAYKNF